MLRGTISLRDESVRSSNHLKVDLYSSHLRCHLNLLSPRYPAHPLSLTPQTLKSNMCLLMACIPTKRTAVIVPHKTKKNSTFPPTLSLSLLLLGVYIMHTRLPQLASPACMQWSPFLLLVGPYSIHLSKKPRFA